ncbi:hypothetical protein H8E65_02440 [Candidatus Bathyarchaeota archaeon]|nr:hypothetical protein [Candidatus Bathyarchaeota archaeon]MBL7079096.1 hypothetical protein [Candidatus Bathyarchaeota archaeon]
MTEEAVEKKVFENTDFKFSAAYGAYSERFDQSEEDEERQRLNDLIVKLDTNEISYPNFYDEVSKPDQDEDEKRYKFHRTRITGSRKFAARKAEQKSDRVKRHKR